MGIKENHMYEKGKTRQPSSSKDKSICRGKNIKSGSKRGKEIKTDDHSLRVTFQHFSIFAHSVKPDS